MNKAEYMIGGIRTRLQSRDGLLRLLDLAVAQVCQLRLVGNASRLGQELEHRVLLTCINQSAIILSFSSSLLEVGSPLHMFTKLVLIQSAPLYGRIKSRQGFDLKSKLEMWKYETFMMVAAKSDAGVLCNKIVRRNE